MLAGSADVWAVSDVGSAFLLRLLLGAAALAWGRGGEAGGEGRSSSLPPCWEPLSEASAEAMAAARLRPAWAAARFEAGLAVTYDEQ